MHEKENKKSHPFQFGYMSNPGLNIYKAFREQVESNIALNFDFTTTIPIKNVLKKDNTGVISLLMFYENRKNMFFKVLISVVCCNIYYYV